jgi:hypothetical protein
MALEFDCLVVSYITRSAPSAMTSEYLDSLRALGATVLRGQSATDVSLARCLQAAGVRKYLLAHDEIQFHLWLDDDVATSLDCTRALLAVTKVANQTCACSVSGAYVNRHRVTQDYSELNAHLLKWTHAFKDIEVDVSSLEGCEQIPKTWILRPALTGLGCLLQPRDVFLEHCDESPEFSYGQIGNMIPMVCNSRIISSEEMALYINLPANAQSLRFWQGEDYDYCVREFMCGRPVFFAPIDFAHESRTILLPSKDTVLPGLMFERSQ